MQAITTKLLPCTDTKPARVKATAGSGRFSVTVSRHVEDDSLTIEQVHGYAAKKLAEILHWYTPTNYLIGGGVGNDFVWVFSDSQILAPKDADPS